MLKVIISRRPLAAGAGDNAIIGSVTSMAQGSFNWESEHRAKGNTGAWC